ncbi:MAG: hypothetical protein ABJA94_12270, partial [Rhodoglobus sp.]
MRLAPGGRSVAAGEAASTVSHGEADALSRGEEAPRSTNIDDLAARTEHDRHDSRVAGVTLDRLDTDRDGLTLEP